MRRGFPQVRQLARDRQGVTAIEFGIAMPVMALMLMGLFDLGFQVYAQSVLQGAVQQAARASTLETGGINSTTLDTTIEEKFHDVIPGAELDFSRKNYANFEDVGIPEDFDDTNNDDTCNNGEVFEDINSNGNWDEDRGADGLGGARDAVLYSVSASYSRVFPFHNFVGLPEEITVDGSTVLRNQPYDEQAERTPETGTCS
jgi:Flp pilus assembly pilin Flp